MLSFPIRIYILWFGRNLSIENQIVNGTDIVDAYTNFVK